MSIEKIYDWENMNVSGIIHVMVKWLGFHYVEFTVKRRDNVESGIWYDIDVKDENFIGLFNVSSQRIDLLKERLIESLDRRNIREAYKNGTNKE